MAGTSFFRTPQYITDARRYDPGRDASFASFARLEQIPREREVILVDATRDLRLAEIKKKAEALLSEFPHLETKIRYKEELFA